MGVTADELCTVLLGVLSGSCCQGVDGIASYAIDLSPATCSGMLYAASNTCSGTGVADPATATQSCVITGTSTVGSSCVPSGASAAASAASSAASAASSAAS